MERRRELYTDEEWEQCKLFDYYYETLEFCGCYWPHEGLKTLFDVLKWQESPDVPKGADYHKIYGEHREQRNQWFRDNADKVWLLVMYLLDSKGITEHGSGIGSAWPNSDEPHGSIFNYWKDKTVEELDAALEGAGKEYREITR